MPWQFLAFIFSVTLFTYNFQRIVKIKLAHIQPISGDRAVWMEANKYSVYSLTIAGAIVGFVFGWEYFKDYAFTLIAVGALSFFYVWKLPFLKLNLRSIPAFKIFVLGFTWVLATQFLPYKLFAENHLEVNSVLVLFSSFLFIISISIPFDIRDIEVDEKKLRTIPQIVGINNSKWIGIFLLISSAGLLMISIQQFNIGILIGTILTAIIIGYSGKYKSDLFYSGLVDGALIYQLFLYYFFK